MLSNVNYAIFPSDELLTFSKSTLALVIARSATINGLTPFITNVEEKHSRFQQALEREQKNPLTRQQQQYDKMNNEAFLSLRNYIVFASTRRKEGWKEAAEKTEAVIRKHGWSAYRWGYKAKSAAINNVISELRTRYPAEVALIQGTELIDELEIAQKDFEAIAQQHTELASTNNEPTVSETRPELTAALRALFQFVGLQQIAAPSPEVDQLIAALSEHITKSLSTVKASETRTGNAKKTSENSTTSSDK